MMEKCKCMKCRHKWLPRTEKEPMECPVCKSRSWNGKEIKNNKYTYKNARKFIEDVIDLHKQGKDTEQILFSLNCLYEEPGEKDGK